MNCNNYKKLIAGEVKILKLSKYAFTQLYVFFFPLLGYLSLITIIGTGVTIKMYIYVHVYCTLYQIIYQANFSLRKFYDIMFHFEETIKAICLIIRKRLFFQESRLFVCIFINFSAVHGDFSCPGHPRVFSTFLDVP